MKQRIAVVIVTAAVAVGAGFVGLGTASAASSATCSTTGTSTIKPGLTTSPQTESTTLTGSLTKCSGSGGVKSGKFTGHVGAKNQSCQGLASAGKVVGVGSETVTWNNGKKSTANITIKTAKPVGSFTVVGKIKTGLFAGHTLTGALHQTKLTGACSASSPLTKINFAGTTRIS